MSQSKIISLLFATYVAAVLVPFSYVQFMTPDSTMQVELTLQWFYVAYVLIAVLGLGAIGILIQDIYLQHVSFLNLMIGGAGYLASSLLYAMEKAWLVDRSSPGLLVAVDVIFSVIIAQVIAEMIKHALANRRVGLAIVALEYSDQPGPHATLPETLFASMFGFLMLVPAFTHVLLADKFSWITLLSAGLSMVGVIIMTWLFWRIEKSEKAKGELNESHHN